MSRRQAEFANAVTRQVTDYAGDPVADSQRVAIDEHTTLDMVGYGGVLTLGDKGGPMFTFGGAVPFPVELVRAGPSYGTPAPSEEGGMISSSAGDSWAGMSDPVMRTLAQRFRRGQQ